MKILLLVLMAVLCGGCFVLDEIDDGLEIMDTHTADSEKTAPVKVGAAQNSDGSAKSARERLNEYYAKQRAKAPQSAAAADPEDKVGRCEIRGSTHYTRRSDCRLRGGRFL